MPLLLRYPRALGRQAGAIDAPINAPDLMPTLLGLCGVEVPASVEGDDLSPVIRGEQTLEDNDALIACYRPFHELHYRTGARDYRGLRTRRYTYVASHDGPWMLYDNETDPYQLGNLVDHPIHQTLIHHLDDRLRRKLASLGDEFLSGEELVQRYGIAMDENDDIAVQW